MYSNPTGLFNTSLPDKMMRTKNYTFVSYKQFRDLQAKNNTNNNEEDQQQDAPEDFTREWSTNHSQGPVLALLQVKSKVNSIMKVEVQVSITGENPNIVIPKTSFKQNVFSNDTRVFANFQKLVPDQDWNGTFELRVITAGMQSAASVQATTPTLAITSGDFDNTKICGSCAERCFQGETFCSKCGSCLDDDTDPQDGVLYGPGNDANYFN